MGRIDELMRRLAPNGVEFKPLGDVLAYKQPGAYLVESTNYDDSFAIPVLTAGQTFILGYTNETSGIYEASPETPVVIFDDFTTSFKWVDFPFKAKSSAMKMLTPKHDSSIDLRYVYFVMQTIAYHPQDHARQWIGTYSDFRIPVPPLEVQREIVRILDYFTKVVAELVAELVAEQIARRRQYSFYRDQLLEFSEGIPRIPIGDVLSLRAGKFIAASQISTVQDAQHPYPCFGGNGLRGYVAEATHDGDYVLIGRQGAWSGNIKRATGKFYATEHAVVVSPIGEFKPAWLFHELTAMNLNQYVSQGAQPGLAVTKLSEVLIPVPDVNEQDRVAGILDGFDSLTNDLSVGLRAELNARRKQYEYFRDKLLAFPEVAA